MKKLLLTAALASLLVSPAAFTAEEGSDVEERVKASRMAIKGFFGELKGALVTAIKAGGPVNALNVCNAQAPAITAAHSKPDLQLARTSLKLRNPANAPDAWEKSVLEKFEARKAAGEDPMKMEYHEVVEMDGKQVFRYMKAIPTAAKPCLACHGEKVAPGVEEKLKQLYPADQARGYKAGDIRGAFTIKQPM